MANTKQHVTHCIFDMDGLILDSETLYTQAYNSITQKYGKEYTWEHKTRLMGLKSVEATQKVVQWLDLPISGEEFEEELNKVYKKIFPNCNLMPGAERLIQHLKKNDIPIALATSSCKENSDIKTARWTHLFDLFHHKVFGGTDPEVLKGKPNPDIFLVAARRFPDNPDPAKCLVFEDSPNGVDAALAAGMQVVMVPDPKLPQNQTGRATVVLKTLEDFKPEDFGLPAFPN